MAELHETDLISDANLTSYYQFNDGAITTDHEAAHTLTNNSSVTNTASGKFGYGIDTTGGGYLSCTDNFGVGDGAFSLSIWFKASGEIGAAEDSIISYQTSTGKYHYMCLVYNGGDRKLWNARQGSNYVLDQYSYGTMGTTWHHVVQIWDGTTWLDMWLDNSRISHLDASTVTGSSGVTNKLYIGAGEGANPGYFDDMAFFNRALTSDEVGTLYSDGVTGTNMQINIGDTWKTVDSMQINIGDSWKAVTKAQINIGDTWKSIF
jgi:hypothetical protein